MHGATPNATEPQARLRAILFDLEWARLALCDSCHAVTAAEANLLIKREERDRLAAMVAELAERAEAIERELAGG